MVALQKKDSGDSDKGFVIIDQKRINSLIYMPLQKVL